MQILILIFYMSFTFKSASTFETSTEYENNIKRLLQTRLRSDSDYESSVLNLINRIIPEFSSDFVIKIDQNLNQDDPLIDTFEVNIKKI